MSPIKNTQVQRYLRTVLISALFAIAVQATSVPRLTFEQLVDESDAIVTGVVSRRWTEWDAEHRFIWTRSEIIVHQTHKGAAAKSVVVNEPGGEVDGTGMSVAGSVRFNAGDQVLLFLKNYPGLGYRTHGLGQGKYLVDSKGLLHADGSLRAVELTPLGAGTPQSGAAIGRLGGLTLADAQRQIAARVRQELQAGKGVAK